MLDLLRIKSSIAKDKTYRVQWHSEKEEWHVQHHKEELLQAFREQEDAHQEAREIAVNDRPSRIVNVKW